MTAFANLSEVIDAATGSTAEKVWWMKDDRSGTTAMVSTAARYHSMFTLNPGGSAPGGTPRNPTSATAGCFGFVNASGGRQKWMLSAGVSCQAQGTLIMADRLADVSGFAANTTTPNTITGMAVTRFTGASAAFNQLWAEIYTQVGASNTTLTATYTNESGTGSRSATCSFGGTGLREIQRFVPLMLQAGDKGVRSVQSCVLTATTGTAGDYGLTIVRPIFEMMFPIAGAGALRDFVAGQPGPIEIVDDMALFPIWSAQGSTAPRFFGSMFAAER